VILAASPHHNTLLHFRFNPEHSAERGRHGEGSNRTGREGHSIELPVPVGTVVYNFETGEQLFDFIASGQRFTVAKGGRGGRGNARFATSTHQAPTEHEEGKAGEAVRLRFELKLLADAGLVGFPNAGKSTLISRMSAARPKIADYPFTTLEPNLGVVQAGNQTFVLADIPGLIEGAHEGHGLGVQFLRHVERTRLLVHLVDVSDFTGRDPGHDFDVILTELQSFSQELAAKPMIVVANKIDACQDQGRMDAVRAKAAENGMPFHEISAATGEGVEDLKFAIAALLVRQPGNATIASGS
jgi:GTP-binding protein